MAGRPSDAKSAFIRSNVLQVIDGRGNVFTYEPSITTDANGDDIVAPADFARAEVADNAVMVIDSSGSVWLYSLIDGLWRKGPSVDEKLPGEEDNTTNPWKQGHNVTAPAPVDEAAPAKRKSKAA